MSKNVIINSEDSNRFSSISNLPSFSTLCPHYQERIIYAPEYVFTKQNVKLFKFFNLDDWKSCYVSHVNTSCDIQEYCMLFNSFFESCLYQIQSLASGHVTHYPKRMTLEHHIMHIWQLCFQLSLKSQTLLHTAFSLHNYQHALSMLQSNNSDGHGANLLTKYRCVLAVQNYNSLSKIEQSVLQHLSCHLSELYIAFIEKQVISDSGATQWYSVLIKPGITIDNCLYDIRQFEIKLPGCPFLGDGKGDNQNHAIVFCRGEWIQTVDANQDLTLKNAFMMPSTLLNANPKYEIGLNTSPYKLDNVQKPFVMLGLKEYIISRNLGIVADIMALQEGCFNAILQKFLALFNMRLHYGHSDICLTSFFISHGGKNNQSLLILTRSE